MQFTILITQGERNHWVYTCQVLSISKWPTDFADGWKTAFIIREYFKKKGVRRLSVGKDTKTEGDNGLVMAMIAK